jgi:hypothetical protein
MEDPRWYCVLIDEREREKSNRELNAWQVAKSNVHNKLYCSLALTSPELIPKKWSGGISMK